MTKMILNTGAGVEDTQLVFLGHSDVTALPDRPGIFVLLGKQDGSWSRPLYFGYADSSMRDQLPYDPGFAQAIRQGPVGFASAYVPGGQDPMALIAELAAHYDAPVNAKAAALAEIDEARHAIQAQAHARRLAAQ